MSNKKKGLLLLVFLFIVPVVFASSYDKWVLAGKDISFDNTIFTTAINQRGDIATIGFDSELFLIGNGDCQASALYRVCFRDTRFNLTADQGEYNATTEIKTPELHITIDKITPTIAITRKIDKKEFLINDEATISVLIDNQGEQKVYNLEYRDIIPKGFIIVEIDGVTASGNTIRWSWPSLATEMSFSYKIKLIAPTNASWKANLSYVFDSNAFTKETDAITVKTIEAPNPLNVKTSLLKSNIKIGESTTYTINLTNIDTKNYVDVDEFIVSIPRRVEIKSYGELEKSENNLIWRGKLGSGESKVFDIKLKCDYTGDNKINVSIKNSFYNDIEKKTYTRTKNYTDSLKSDFTRPVPLVKFMFDKTTINYGDKSNVRAFIENKDSKIPLFEVKFRVKSKLFDDFENTLENILPGQKVEAYYFPFTAPSLTQDTIYKVNFSGSYRTLYYEYFEFSSEGSITVKKNPNAIVEEQEQTEEVETEPEETSNRSVREDVIVENITSKQITQKQENFFVKFFKALANLIKDLF